MAAAALTALRKRLSRRLAGEVGGPRRLHALVTAAAASLLAPHAAWSYLRAGAAERAAWLGGGAVLCAAGALALCGLVLNCVHPNPDPNPNPHPDPDPDPNPNQAGRRHRAEHETAEAQAEIADATEDPAHAVYE